MTRLRIPEHVTWYRRGDTVVVIDLRTHARRGLTGRLAALFRRAASSHPDIQAAAEGEPALIEKLVSAGLLYPPTP